MVHWLPLNMERPSIQALPEVVGFELAGVLGMQDVVDILRSVPSRHVSPSELRVIRYVDECRNSVPRHRRFPSITRFGECLEIVPREITIYRQTPQGNPEKDFFVHTLLHEIGHSVLATVGSDTAAEWFGMHRQSVAYISNAAAQDAGEDFAECYAAYAGSPWLKKAVLDKRFPSQSEFIRTNVFDQGCMQ